MISKELYVRLISKESYVRLISKELYVRLISKESYVRLISKELYVRLISKESYVSVSLYCVSNFFLCFQQEHYTQMKAVVASCQRKFGNACAACSLAVHSSRRQTQSVHSAW